MSASWAEERIEFLRRQRQTRTFTDQPVSDADVQTILDVARWTGSAGNAQPWKFVVIRDREIIAALSTTQKHTAFLINASLVIAPVMEAHDPFANGYDEGRLSERILLAAQALGLGAGVAWYFEPQGIETARRILNVPAESSLMSAIAIGHPTPVDPNKPKRDQPRKPLSDLVVFDRFP
jgi:nitroreductase